MCNARAKAPTQDFVHTHVHSHFSVQDALPSPKQLAQFAREQGYRAIALTDHGRMSGCLEFVEHCTAPYKDLDPITPICGYEAYTYHDRFDLKPVTLEDGTKRRPKYNHLTLLAMDPTGYQNLCRMSSIAMEKHFYHNPVNDFELITQFSEGVTAMTGCLASETSKAILAGDLELAEQIMRRFKEVFGDRYFAELQYHGIPEQLIVGRGLIPLARKLGVRLIATNDVHYLQQKDAVYHDYLIQMRDAAGKNKADAKINGKLEAYGTHNFHLKTTDEMAALGFPPEAITNSVFLAERVTPYKPDATPLLPTVVVPAQDTEFHTWREEHMPYQKPNEAYLAFKAMKGLARLGLNNNPEYKARLRYEWSTIVNMGVVDYFLIQKEAVDWMNENNVWFGVRGSGVGSLLNYCLDISASGPIKYNLQFERFLNPGRGTQYKIDLPCLSLKDWRAEGTFEDQDAANDRLTQLLNDKVLEEEFKPFGPAISKELWVLKSQGLTRYLCDIADRGLKTDGNPCNIWAAFFLGIAATRPDGDMIVYKHAPLPDVDNDIDPRRRGALIEWARQRFGHDCVAQIMAVGTYGARSSVSSVLKLSPDFQAEWGELTVAKAEEIAKTIPFKPDITIDKAIELAPEFATWVNRYPNEIDVARNIFGKVSHESLHAGGVIMCGVPIKDIVPVQRTTDKDGNPALYTAFDKDSVEKVGLVKYDILGLSLYEKLERATALIEKRHGKRITLNFLKKMELDDPAVYEMVFKQAMTQSVFQFSSDGMQKHMRQLRPDTFEDLVALVALYRPGPMEFIPQYIEGKNNPDAIHYSHPLIEKYLKPTHKLIIYQEQAMFLTKEMAGLDWLETDVVRKAISKKDDALFQKAKAVFEVKALARGIPAAVVQEVLDMIKSFSGYAFNRCHALGYAQAAYWTAALRAEHGPEWMAACIEVDRSDDDKMTMYRRECINRIRIIKPTVNESGMETTVTREGAVALPLTAIKSVGKMVEPLVLAQPFESFKDMVFRAKPNRGIVEALSEGGALECLPDVKKRHQTAELMDLFDELVRERKSEEKRTERDAKAKFHVQSPLLPPPVVANRGTTKRAPGQVRKQLNPADIFGVDMQVTRKRPSATDKNKTSTEGR